MGGAGPRGTRPLARARDDTLRRIPSELLLRPDECERERAGFSVAPRRRSGGSHQAWVHGRKGYVAAGPDGGDATAWCERRPQGGRGCVAYAGRGGWCRDGGHVDARWRSPVPCFETPTIPLRVHASNMQCRIFVRKQPNMYRQHQANQALPVWGHVLHLRVRKIYGRQQSPEPTVQAVRSRDSCKRGTNRLPGAQDQPHMWRRPKGLHGFRGMYAVLVREQYSCSRPVGVPRRSGPFVYGVQSMSVGLVCTARPDWLHVAELCRRFIPRP